jgi:hypothetical protein
MAVEEVLLERTALPEQSIAVITRWWRIPEDGYAPVLRRYMSDDQGDDPLERKETTIYAAEVTAAGTLRIKRNKKGNAAPLGHATYHYRTPRSAVSAGHRAIVDAIESGRVRVHGNTALSACLQSLLIPPTS